MRTWPILVAILIAVIVACDGTVQATNERPLGTYLGTLDHETDALKFQDGERTCYVVHNRHIRSGPSVWCSQ